MYVYKPFEDMRAMDKPDAKEVMNALATLTTEAMHYRLQHTKLDTATADSIEAAVNAIRAAFALRGVANYYDECWEKQVHKAVEAECALKRIQEKQKKTESK